MPTLLGEIQLLAKLPRSLPANVFTRVNYGYYQNTSIQRREQLLAAVLQIFKGNTWRFIDPMPSESVGEARKRVGKYERRLLYSFMNKWNTLYSIEPIRTFTYDGERLDDKNKPDVLEALQLAYAQASVDDVMEQSDTLLRLTGNVGLRPWYDADNEELVIHCYSGNNIRVLKNANNPKRPLGVALVGSSAALAEDGTEVSKQNAEYFTAENMGLIVDDVALPTESLETKHIPIAFGWEKTPSNKTGFFVDAPGVPLAAVDRLMANDMTSQLGFFTLMQGFGIPVSWGLNKGVEIEIGPDKRIEFEGNLERKEDFEFKDANAPLDEVKDVINQMIEWTREDYDIPKSMLDASMTSSGVAQVEANAPLGIMRQKRAKQMRPLESNTLSAITDVLITSNVLAKGLDPDKFGVSVYYPEPQITKSTSDQIAQDKFELEQGITTRAAIFMRENPSRFDGEDEAELFLKARGLVSLETETGTGEPDVESPATEGSPSIVDDGGVSTDDSPANEAMNGAQVTALQGLVESVTNGDMPSSSAILVAKAAFPTIPHDELVKMFKDAEKFEAQQEPESNTGLLPNELVKFPPVGKVNKDKEDDRANDGSTSSRTDTDDRTSDDGTS